MLIEKGAEYETASGLHVVLKIVGEPDVDGLIEAYVVESSYEMLQVGDMHWTTVANLCKYYKKKVREFKPAVCKRCNYRNEYIVDADYTCWSCRNTL